MKTETIATYETQGSDIITHAESIVIVDETTRELEAEFSQDIAHAHQLHKDLLSRQKKLVEPFEIARIIADKEIRRDFTEREKIRRGDEWKAQQKAQAQRIEQETALAKEADELIMAGDIEEAEAILDSEVVTPPVIPVKKVAQTTSSGAGSTTVKKDVRVEVVDKVRVIEAVAKRELPATLLTVDMGNAKRYVKVSGVTEMPGFRITETAVVSGRVR